MAPSAKQFSLFILFTLLSASLHRPAEARDSQFFNKVTSTTPTTVPTTTTPASTTEQLPTNQQQQNQQEQEPDFVVPDKEDSYGLYSHQTGQLPPSATTTSQQQPLNKHLPKNYNPVAYVTQPEEDNTENTPAFTEQKSFSTNPTNYYNAATTNRNYYDTQLEQEQEPEDEEQEQQVPQEYRNYPSTTTPKYNYNLGSSFNTPRRTSTNNNVNNNNNNGFRPQPQGMSDTRFLENGKYYYDVNNEKYNANHPYETLKTAANRYNGNRNFYSNNRGNGYDQFQNQNYQDEDQFQNEEINNYNMP